MKRETRHHQMDGSLHCCSHPPISLNIPKEMSSLWLRHGCFGAQRLLCLGFVNSDKQGFQSVQWLAQDSPDDGWRPLYVARSACVRRDWMAPLSERQGEKGWGAKLGLAEGDFASLAMCKGWSNFCWLHVPTHWHVWIDGKTRWWIWWPPSK